MSSIKNKQREEESTLQEKIFYSVSSLHTSSGLKRFLSKVKLYRNSTREKKIVNKKTSNQSK